MMRIAPLLFALAPATAWADACQETVRAAFGALARVGAVDQTTTIEGMPTIRSITVGNTLYLDQGAGHWTKVPLQPGMRQKQPLPDAATLTGCAKVGRETLGGAHMTIYQYRPRAPARARSEPALQTVWIGDADGLPHRMMTEQEGRPMVTTMVYKGVTAPGS